MQNITKEKYTGFIESAIAWNIRDLFKEIISFLKKRNNHEQFYFDGTIY